MAEALKHFFSPTLIQSLAEQLRKAHPPFAAQAFARDATLGLDRLELMERARQIARALHKHLPPTYEDAIAILVRSLGPEHTRDELTGVGMGPFFYLPHILYVSECGVEHFELSMHAQYELTKRFTAEFSIRKFLDRYPEPTLAKLAEWANDPNAHVRRLASEGTRLRLPWASRLGWLEQHPQAILKLLEKLKDDPSTLVRRSVANNLNDLGKVYPDVLKATCRVWLSNASKERRALIEHALRSIVKRGDTEAMAILGFGGKPNVKLVHVRATPKRVRIGGTVLLAFELHSKTSKPQSLLVDIIVHFVKASGKTSPKVFKLSRVDLAPKQHVLLSKRLSLKVHTTRVPHAGQHVVEVIVNGQRYSATSFNVV